MGKDSLKDLMNGPIRKKLQIIPDCVQWGGTLLAAVGLVGALLPIAGWRKIQTKAVK